MVCDEDNSFNILMKKYKPLINKISRNYYHIFKKFGYELDDIIQLGYITLFKSSSFYNVYNETMFYTYFKRSLNNALINEIRNNLTSKKTILNNAISYDTLIPNTNICYIDLLEDNNNVYDYSKELTIFKNSMSFKMSLVFELFYNGYTKEEISILLDEELNIIKELFKKIKIHALTYKSLFLK